MVLYLEKQEHIAEFQGGCGSRERGFLMFLLLPIVTRLKLKATAVLNLSPTSWEVTLSNIRLSPRREDQTLSFRTTSVDFDGCLSCLISFLSGRSNVFIP